MDSTSPPTRSRGRSRGGRGKAIRARGRGGRGRAAEFAPRLVLEHEQNLDDEEEEERQREIREKYAKRELASNAHRYEDPPEDENAEDVEPEPEVDLSSFIEKQKLSDASSPILSLSSGNTKKIGPDIDDDDIDHTLDHLFPSSSKSHNNKGKHEVIEWDEEVEAMKQAKEQAEAHWELKQRLKGNPKTLTSGVITTSIRAKGPIEKKAPLLNQSGPQAKKDEEFLDDLLL